MSVDKKAQTATCDECGETYARQQIKDGEIRFHMRGGRLLCELCAEDNDERHIDALIDRLDAEG